MKKQLYNIFIQYKFIIHLLIIIYPAYIICDNTVINNNNSNNNGVTETLIPDFSFIPDSDFIDDRNNNDNKKLTLVNSFITKTGISLRGAVESNSFISINNPRGVAMTPLSIELVLKNPELEFPESLDIDLFFTENKLDYISENNMNHVKAKTNNEYLTTQPASSSIHSSKKTPTISSIDDDASEKTTQTNMKEKLPTYKNVTSSFHGINISLTFIGTRLTITIGYNPLTHTYTPYSYIVQDHIDPKRFLHTQTYRFKYIFTSNNIKVEIYNHETNTLLYDKLRFTEKNVFGDLDIYKYITFTNSFNKISSERNLLITNLNVYSRKEDKTYNKNLIYTKPISLLDTNTNQNQKNSIESKEIQHLISNLEHFMFYLKLILGETDGTSLNNKILNLRRIVSNNHMSLNQITNKLDSLYLLVNNNTLSKLTYKLQNIDKNINQIERLLIDSNLRISNIKESHWLGVKFILGVVCFLIFVYIGGMIVYEKFIKIKMGKLD
ncbi:hypothetical protein CDIK_0766 [Cucumispora dikerogammari]|nr:hypothetical protein CDIK_0766 [Cucumispora dikerogammari]